MEEVIERLEALDVKRYKTRLLLGEGDFSYACALVKIHLESHPGLGHAIVASAYESEDELRQKYPHTLDQHIRYLQENSVRVLFRVDATTLHTDVRFKDTTFDCIHFNFPNVPGSYNRGALRQMLGAFYRSARSLQNLKGRIYMALVKPPNQDHYDNANKIASNVYYKAIAYGIYENTRNAGYALVKKRRFGKDRYPGYQHVQTQKSNSASVAERFPKEYVFEKTDLSPEEILAQDKRRDIKPPFDNQTKKFIIPEIKTDGDSTEYTFMDSEKPNLYPIANPLMAKEWILRLLRKQKELFEIIEKGFKPELSDIKKFIKRLKSVEVYLSGNSKKLFYTHNSGFRWKSHIANWYYRGILERENTPRKSEENIELKHQFISFLLSIIKKTPCAQYTGYITNALEALFYLFEYNSERILNEVAAVVEKPDMSYECKAVAFSILMKRHNNPAFRNEKLIPLLIKSLGYDPRLDWMICAFLSNFDITKFIINPSYSDYFKKINDYRLIARMLEKSDFRKLHKKKKRLPTFSYQQIASYLWFKKDKQPLDEQSQIVREAVTVPTIISPCFERDLISWEFRAIQFGLCSNIFMPAQSVEGNTVLTNLQDRHQECSFITVGRYYLSGSNGCKQNYRKALGYFKVPADNGSQEALHEIVRLYSEGLVDVSSDNLDYGLQHCIKLQESKTLMPQQRSVVFHVRGLIMFFKDDLREAQLCFELALRLNPTNESALFNLAICWIILGNSQRTHELLSQVTQCHQLYKKGLLLFLAGNYDRLFQAFNNTSNEQLSLMALTCGVIAYHQKNRDVALKCFSQVLNLNPSHPAALEFCKKINPDLPVAENSANEQNEKYELIFKCYGTRDKYQNERDGLRQRCSLNRGFFVFITDEKKPETLFLTLSEEYPILDESIKLLAENILLAFRENDKEHVHTLMLELHHFIMTTFNIKPAPNLSLKVDEIERIRIIEDEEELAQILRDKEAAEQRRPHSPGRLGIFGHDEEQDDPDDVEHVENLEEFEKKPTTPKKPGEK